ncbi:hypothetical protein BD626DRAFT_523520 [Schizophyllum amplum]|uniref:Uncharacterized protein n=1 Tax=Schizophyllum amplum TaxID=97359 RepID=A0A550BT14_9AGAR|nr:hypothetical protein BD626DRAFT_523520 [Auriculariopsis ampla]
MAPKFKRKEYKVPKNAVFLVVVNPWGQDGIDRTTSQRGFHNNLGAWLEIACGSRPTCVYYQGTHAEVIVEFGKDVNLNKLLGDHALEDVFGAPGLPGASSIYPYNYKMNGNPQNKQWAEALFDYRDIPAEFPVRRRYPLPRRPEARPKTHHSGILGSIPDDHWDRVDGLRREQRSPTPPLPPPLPPVPPPPPATNFLPYERPVQLAAASIKEEEPVVQVKAELGVKRDPYEEDDDYARNLWPAPTTDEEDVKPIIKAEPDSNYIVKEEDAGGSCLPGVKREDDGGRVSAQWQQMFNGLELPRPPTDDVKPVQAVKSEEAGVNFNQHVKTEHLDDTSEDAGRLLEEVFSQLPEHIRTGQYASSGALSVKADDSQFARSFDSFPPRGVEGPSTGAHSQRIKNEFADDYERSRSDLHGYSRDDSRRASSSRAPPPLQANRHQDRSSPVKRESDERSYLQRPDLRADIKPSLGYRDAARDPRRRGEPPKRELDGDRREDREHKRVKSERLS